MNTPTLPETHLPTRPKPGRAWIFVLGIVVLGALIVAAVWFRSSGRTVSGEAGHENHEEHSAPNEVALDEEILKTAGVEIGAVDERRAGQTLRVTGTVEADSRRVHLVTPLVAGRVERVAVAPGDRVRAGDPLVEIASPEYAERRGKLLEAETRLNLAERNYQRVKLPENRVTVLQTRARLDEAEATLNRTKKLIELGAGAGKDLTAAEAAYRTAKAEFDFQNNIGLNREAQQAASAFEEARADAAHQRDALRALGAVFPDPKSGEISRPPSILTLRAPFAGTVTERTANAGSGIEAGKSLMTITGLSDVWIIANVPEIRAAAIRIGTPAAVTAAPLGSESIPGRISYIEPTVMADARVARARIEIRNPGERLKIGNFVEVAFETGGPGGEKELFVPSGAVQRLGERSVVFVPKVEDPDKRAPALERNHKDGDHEKESPAKGKAAEVAFEVREVEVGPEANGTVRILTGLKAGERIVVKGAFTLKTQLIKGELGHDD